MEVKVKLHVVLISTLGTSEWSALIPGTSKTRKPLLGNLNWLHKHPICSKKKKKEKRKIAVPVENIIPYGQPVAGHCTDCATTASKTCKLLQFGKI